MPGENVTEEVKAAYGGEDFSFGKDYILPKPFDTRLLYCVAPAVAKAAMDSGVARMPIADWDAYGKELKKECRQLRKRDTYSACGLERSLKFRYRRNFKERVLTRWQSVISFF